MAFWMGGDAGGGGDDRPKPYTQPASIRKPHMLVQPWRQDPGEADLLQRLNCMATSTTQPAS